LRNENLDEWLELWWATQGTAKRSSLELMTAILPFPAEKLLVLDLCCGPGDVGRVIRSRFHKACVDCVDRDSFLLSLCAALNTRVGIEGEIFTRDMWKSNWSAGLSNNCAAIATANALHWFNVARVAELLRDVFRLLGRAEFSCFWSRHPPKPSLPGDLVNGSSGRRTVTIRKLGSGSGRA
jgi:trans-aconitate methyltransferase